VFGLITRIDLFLHPVTVFRDYGWRVLVVGLFLHRGTFLELVVRQAPRHAAHDSGAGTDGPARQARPFDGPPPTAR
jgi:hypothetical protein